jgi:hypothetical protein
MHYITAISQVMDYLNLFLLPDMMDTTANEANKLYTYRHKQDTKLHLIK